MTRGAKSRFIDSTDSAEIAGLDLLRPHYRRLARTALASAGMVIEWECPCGLPEGVLFELHLLDCRTKFRDGQRVNL